MSITELIRPIETTVTASDPLTYAAKHLSRHDYVTVVHSAQDRTPRGIITRGDLAEQKLAHPQSWPLKECGSVLRGANRILSPEAEVEDVVEVLTTSGVRPLLVGANGKPAGVLEPTSIFQWCAEHSPAALEKLAYLVSAEERSRARG